jgi:energy-coupling factor transporter transmembrane protein EcfT
MKIIRFYKKGNSVLHKMHPSTKLVLYVILSILVGILSWQQRLFFTSFVIVFLWACGIPPTKYKMFMLITLPAVFLIPILNGLLAETGDPLIFPLWDNFGFHLTGLERGTNYSTLYLGMSTLTVCWLTTTQIWEIPESLTMLGLPHTVGFVVGNIFRYMPEVAEHALDLADVQRSRGVDFNKGFIWEKFWKQCRLLAFLLILEFSRLRTKSNAYEARGYSTVQKPTPFILPTIPVSEKVIMGVTIGLTVLAGVLQLYRRFLS